MTMLEFKPTATAYFNEKVTATELQGFFANEWDAWRDMPCRYDADSDAYKSIIDKHIDALDAVYGYNTVIKADATRTVNDTTTRTGTDKTETHGATTTDGGERGGNAYTYPTGYTEEPDEAYIASRSTEDAYQDGTTEDTDTTVTHNTTDTRTSAESDNLARAAVIDPEKAAQAHAIIRACVFAFVANVYTGVF